MSEMTSIFQNLNPTTKPPKEITDLKDFLNHLSEGLMNKYTTRETQREKLKKKKRQTIETLQEAFQK